MKKKFAWFIQTSKGRLTRYDSGYWMPVFDTEAEAVDWLADAATSHVRAIRDADFILVPVYTP